MPFDDSKKRDDSLSNYEITLSIISTLINKAKTLNIPIFIVGDFNADLSRNNRFDKKLKEYTYNHKIGPINYLFPQKIDYTFKSILRDEMIKANIDYAFFIPRMKIS